MKLPKRQYLFLTFDNQWPFICLWCGPFYILIPIQLVKNIWKMPEISEKNESWVCSYTVNIDMCIYNAVQSLVHISYEK